MLAGQLELQLVADVARLRRDIDEMRGVVNRGAQAMQKSIDEVRGSLRGMFGGVSAAGFAMWVKSAIDFADELNDLNKTTDIAVNKLAGLSLMSKQSGSDLTGTAQAINKLTMEMGKAPEKFAAIGVSAKDPLEAFKQFSEVFRNIADPQMRAAVAAGALGKSWAAAAPALAEGADRIQEMVDRGEALAGITKRDAELADEFNDSVSELHISLMGTASGIARDMLPMLTDLAKTLTDVSHEANQTDTGFSLIAETMRALIVFGGNVAFVLHGIATEIGGIAAQAGAFLRGDFAQAKTIGEEMAADAERRRQTFDDWEKRAMAAGRATVATSEAQRELTRELNRMRQASEGASTKALKDFIDSGAAAKKAAEDAKKAAEEVEKLNREIDKRVAMEQAQMTFGGKVSEGMKFQIDILAKIESLKGKIAQSEKDALVARAKQVAQDIDEYNKAAEAAQKRVDLRKADSEAALAGAMAIREADAAAVKSANEAVKSAQEEYDQRSLLKSQIAQITLLTLQEAQAKRAAGSEGYEALQKQIDAQKQLIDILRRGELRDANEKAAEEAASAWRTVGDSFVENLMQGGKSVAQYLRDLFRTLVLRPILSPIGMGMAAAIGTLPTAANAAGSGMLGALGSTGIGAALGSFGTGFSYGASSLFANGLGMTLDAGTAMLGAGSTAAGLGTLAGALGPIALGVAAIYSLVSKGGETRVGGQYSGTNLLGAPSGGQIDGATQAIAATIESINGTLRALGSGAQLQQLVSGLEESKNGKGFAYAGGFLSSGAAFGNVTNGFMNRRGSMTSQEALAAFGEELKQATLQALQAADLTGVIGDYLRSLGDIDTLSGGALDAALARVNSYVQQKAALDERLFQLTATDEQKLARARDQERAATDALLQSTLDEIYAKEDAAKATQAAAEAAKQLQDQYDRNVDTARQNLQDAYAREADTLKDTISRHEGYVKSLRAFQQSLTSGPLAKLSPTDQYNADRAAFERVVAEVNAGNEDAIAQFEDIATKFAQSSLAYFATGTGSQYFKDLDRIKEATEAARLHSQANVDVARLQLNALNAQVSGIIAVNQSVLSVRDAIAALAAAQMQANGGAPPGTHAVQAVGGGTVFLPDPTVQTGGLGGPEPLGGFNYGSLDVLNAINSYQQSGVNNADIASGLLANGISLERVTAAYSDVFGTSLQGPMLDELVRSYELARQAAANSHAGGLARVPYDGYVATLHAGERVSTATETDALEAMPQKLDELTYRLDKLITAVQGGDVRNENATHAVSNALTKLATTIGSKV